PPSPPRTSIGSAATSSTSSAPAGRVLREGIASLRLAPQSNHELSRASTIRMDLAGVRLWPRIGSGTFHGRCAQRGGAARGELGGALHRHSNTVRWSRKPSATGNHRTVYGYLRDRG